MSKCKASSRKRTHILQVPFSNCTEKHTCTNKRKIRKKWTFSLPNCHHSRGNNCAGSIIKKSRLKNASLTLCLLAVMASVALWSLLLVRECILPYANTDVSNKNSLGASNHLLFYLSREHLLLFHFHRISYPVRLRPQWRFHFFLWLTVVSGHWVLGIETGSSGRATSALNRWTISPAGDSCCSRGFNSSLNPSLASSSLSEAILSTLFQVNNGSLYLIVSRVFVVYVCSSALDLRSLRSKIS